MQGTKSKLCKVIVFGMTENPGGTEAFLVNYYRHIDRSKIQFDFLCNFKDPAAYEEELVSLGARMFHVTARSHNMRLYRKELDQIFKEHGKEWDIIWVNVCSLANIDYLKVAKKYGIKNRIIHGHNSQNMCGKLRGLLHKWNKRNIKKYATEFWACSEEAANYFYDNNLKKNQVIYIHNAIDVKKMEYNQIKREQMRNNLGIGNEFVIGNVGRLHFQKNQSFIIDIYSNFVKMYPYSRLIFVGQGDDEYDLRKKCKVLGVEDKVVFAGVQKDIGAWLSVFDFFLFPSLFEGLGIAALEAQANGLPVLASKDVIPQEVKINGNFAFYSLENSAEKWAVQIKNMKNKTGRISFDAVYRNFILNDYDICTEIKKLEELLVSMPSE